MAKIKYFTTTQVYEAFSANFLSEQMCREWMVKTLHPEGIFCPECETKISDEDALRRFAGGKKMNCKKCGKSFNWCTGTFLYHTGLTEQQVVLTAFLFKLGVSYNQAASILKVDKGTWYIWKKRFESFEQVAQVNDAASADSEKGN